MILTVSAPQSAAHYTAIQKTARALAAIFGSGWEVRTQGPIRLDDGSEPEPDVTVVPGSPDDYCSRHPSRPTLTVEVAESSLEIDRISKGSLYARAWLAEYWVLNLTDRVLEVYRKPVGDPSAPFGWRYAQRDVLAASARATPLAAPGSSIVVAALLPWRGHDSAWSGAGRPSISPQEWKNAWTSGTLPPIPAGPTLQKSMH
jgi:hypothetical protein